MQSTGVQFIGVESGEIILELNPKPIRHTTSCGVLKHLISQATRNSADYHAERSFEEVIRQRDDDRWSGDSDLTDSFRMC